MTRRHSSDDHTSLPMDLRNLTASGLRQRVSAKSDGIFPARVISLSANSTSSSSRASASSFEMFLNTVSLGGSTRPFLDLAEVGEIDPHPLCQVSLTQLGLLAKRAQTLREIHIATPWTVLYLELIYNGNGKYDE